MAADEKPMQSGKVPRLHASAPNAADPLVERAAARVGNTLLGKWRLDVLLGVGGAAAVYAATHRNGSRAAVKVLHPEMTANALVREQFLWEGYIANAVSHEGAVRVLDDDEDGTPFLVTELLDGETLEERRIRLGGRLPESEVLIVIDRVLDVLAVAHAQGIVHRDLKPENVVLTRTGQVKVIDFGIARFRDQSSPANEPQGRAIVGTPAYMAPEHARGCLDEVDERSDIWACGAMMFRMLSGRGVHEGGTTEEELANATSQPAPPLASVAASIDARLSHVVDRALAFSKDMRWADARSMQAAVREAYQEAFGDAITSAPALAIEATVPNRTLPPPPPSGAMSVRWGPSSVRPMSLSGAETYRSVVSGTRSKTPVAIVGGVAIGVAVVGMAALAGLGRAHDGPTGMTSRVVQTMPAMSDPPVATIEPLAMPEIAECVPSVASPRPASQSPQARVIARPLSTQPAPEPPAVAATTALAVPQDCDPPYVVDGQTGKRTWKVECL